MTKSGFRTKKEAQLAANKLEESILNGGVIRESDITFETFANEWLEYYGTQVKVSSVRARRIAMKHLVSTWGHLPLRKISKQNPTYGFVMSKKHVTDEDIEKDEVKEKFLKLNELKTFIRITKGTRIISRLSMYCYFCIYRYALRRNVSIKMDRPGPY
ncbi:Arm DNA-binding domain-containing protein [Bacillus sp. RHFB]|nr:Arm DNA-binding domain-containing protein [Bacillus sp. RHFB]